MYQKDLVPALIFALSEVRYLAISMQSWRESKSSWLKVLRSLQKVKEVVFVREMFDLSSCTKSPEYRLLELEELDVAFYEFSGELVREQGHTFQIRESSSLFFLDSSRDTLK